MPIEFEELSQLGPPEIGRLSAEAPRICRVQIHPFYWGLTKREIELFFEHLEQSMMEFGESVKVDVEARLKAYVHYQRLRRRHVRELKDPWGILLEEEHRIATSLAMLREEDPSVRWLVVRTKVGSWAPLYGNIRTETDAWNAIAERLSTLGARNLEVFGAMRHFCVKETAANLIQTGRFESVDIFVPATLH